MSSKLLFILLIVFLAKQAFADCQDLTLGTIHKLRKHIFRIFGPRSPLHKHVFSTENKQKLAFSDSPPPLQVLT